MVVGVVEDAGYRVVVVRPDGVVLVVVAARAADGKPEEAARRHVDAVVALVGARHGGIGEVVVPGARAKETKAREQILTAVLRHQVRRQLRHRECVVRHVRVEGVDHPVAVDVGHRVSLPTRAVLCQAAGVVLPETRDIEPVPAPFLAVVFRGEQPVHHLLEGDGGAVGEESVHLLSRRREPDEVIGRPADERALVGGTGRGEPALLEQSEHEAIDVGLGPPGFRRRGDLDHRVRAERPEPALHLGGGAALDGDGCLGLRPLGAGLDPLHEPLDFRVRQLGRVAGHAQILALVAQRRDDEALLRVARNDRRTPASALENALTRVEPQAPALFARVAREALLFEHRADLVEEDLGAGCHPALAC